LKFFLSRSLIYVSDNRPCLGRACQMHSSFIQIFSCYGILPLIATASIKQKYLAQLISSKRFIKAFLKTLIGTGLACQSYDRCPLSPPHSLKYLFVNKTYRVVSTKCLHEKWIESHAKLVETNSLLRAQPLSLAPNKLVKSAEECVFVPKLKELLTVVADQGLGSFVLIC